MNSPLSHAEKQFLLDLARKTLEDALQGRKMAKLEPGSIPEKLHLSGASFVTLTKHGRLRGCIGTLEAYQPLVEDVREHTLAAAFNDYRFPAVHEYELEKIKIEISVLSKPEELEYSNPDELLARLRPNIDGITLMDGKRRATFLPQVWEKIPDKVEFLEQLCQKMGVEADLWRKKLLRVQTYQVEEFHE